MHAYLLATPNKNHNHEVHEGSTKGSRPISLRVTFVPLVVRFFDFHRKTAAKAGY